MTFQPCACEPCPWCWEDGDLNSVKTWVYGYLGWQHEGFFHARCADCGASGPAAPTREEAASEWNRVASEVWRLRGLG